MSTDDQNKLVKGQRKKASLYDTLPYWQELLERNQTVSANKAVQAAPIIETFSGSWAGIQGYGDSVRSTDGFDTRTRDNQVPTPKRETRTRLGQPGLPEINFPPYNFNTNQGANKGPALLGHPVSFSVVGPTLKSPYTNWQWSIVDNSATPGVGDQINLDTNIDGTALPAFDLVDYYNFVNVPDGGFYFVVAQTGANGDGEISTAGGRVAITPNAAYGELAKFEIFRIVGHEADTFFLDPGKRIADYFTLAGTPVMRAITLFRPRVSRLLPLPSSGGPGKETVYLVMPPEQSQNGDVYPPYNVDANSWLGGGFNPNGTAGEANAYGGEFNLPVPIPTTAGSDTTPQTYTGRFEGGADGVFAPPSNSGVGTFRIHNVSSLFVAGDVGKVVRVFDINRPFTSDPDNLINQPLRRALGWFEILSVGNDVTFGNFVVLKRLPEIDPNTGEVFWGDGPLDFGADPLEVSFTVHKNISQLFTERSPTIDEVEATRLTNLIDPTEVERSRKVDPSTIAGQSAARADRAIFDTRLNTDPGSLLDLGFRMVLFPGKDDGSGNTVPDFERPINSQNVVIDPAVTTDQTIDIDYSAGIVCLSTPAPNAATSSSAVFPNTLPVGTDNPEGRMVLFASYVAFSQEEGQTGIGLRVTGGQLIEADQGIQDGGQADALSARTVFTLAAGQTLDVRPLNNLDLEELDTEAKLPETGIIDISRSISNEKTLFAPRGSFGYTGKTTYPVDGDPATGTLRVTGTINAGETITIGTATLTASAGAGTPGGNDFQEGSGTVVVAAIVAAINEAANDIALGGFATAVASVIDPSVILVTAGPNFIGADGDTVALSTTSAGLSASGATLTGGLTTQTATRLTGVYTSLSLPIAFGTNEQAILRRDPEIDYGLDTTFGSAARSSALRFNYAKTDLLEDGSLLVTPQATEGPALELRGPFPIGFDDTNGNDESGGDIGRVAFDPESQNWTLSAPPAISPDAFEVGLQITRGKLFTSASYNLGSNQVTVRPFYNRVSEVRPRSAVTASPETPSSRFELLVDPGTVSGLVPSGFSPFAPVTEAQGGGLTATVEGSTITTLAQGAWSVSAGERIIINLKTFGDRSTREASSQELFDLDEGPANPIHWLAVTLAGGETAAALAATINGHYNALTGANPANVGPDDALFLTGRQISVLPSRPLLQSTDVAGGITFGANSTYALSVFSADPNPETRGRWITFEARPGDGVKAFASADPIAIAAYLNAPLYDTANPNFIGDALDNAGFLETPDFVVLSPNPYLQGLGVGERQFLWIGPDDPRHPDGTDTVCLICGGLGSIDGTDQDFFNVLCEAHPTREEGFAAGDDAYTQLAGEFFPLPNTPDQPLRFGLFFGDNADAKNQPLFVNPIAADFATEDVRGTANLGLGFPAEGVEPLGLLVGSYPIIDVTAVGETSRLTVEIPQGRTEFYQGPLRASTATPGNIGDLPRFSRFQEFVSDPSEANRIRNTSGYLGRWVWPVNTVTGLSAPDIGTSAGLLHVWVSYGLHTYDERGFSSPLTATSVTGYPSFLVYTNLTRNPTNDLALSSIMAGDRMLGMRDAINRDGVEPSWEGVILNPDAPLDRPTFFDDKTMTVMISSRGYGANTDHRVNRSEVQPSIFTTFDPTGLALFGNAPNEISLVPQPNAITGSAAVRMALQAEFGTAVNTFNAGGTNEAVLTGSGLDGGSQTSREVSQGNVTVLSGGRMTMLSLQGPNASAGLSFARPVSGALDNNSLTDNLRFAQTHLEHGVYSTSVTLGKAGFGGAIESAGVFDAFRGQAGRDQGSVLGHQAGGVAGLRYSGDAQIWITNARPLSSALSTAVVRQSRIANTAPITDGVGPVVFFGEDEPAGHIPSGYAAAKSSNTVGSRRLLLQEATVSLGLTRAEWQAFQVIAGNRRWPLENDEVFTAGATPETFLAFNAARASDIPIPVPFLQGCYLSLGAASFNLVNPANDSNEGIWRIVGTPMITNSGSIEALAVDPNTSQAFDFPHSPYFQEYNVTSRIESGPPGINTVGHAPASAFVAYVQLRIERFASVRVGGVGTFQDDSFFPQTAGRSADGHPWAIYLDEDAQDLVFVADVVDPGGSPTGASRGLRGLTLNPRALGSGQSTLPIDLVSVFATTNASQEFGLPGRGRLLGIHENYNSRGSYVSQAFFTVERSSAALPATTTDHRAYARMIIYSAQRDDRLDEVALPVTKGEFQQDEAGRVTFVGHIPRLGPGVIVDGGLGLVQATAFRARPRSLKTDTLGALTIWGQGTAPFPNYNNDAKDVGIQMPSTFNNAEVYGDLSISGPDGRIIIESARAAEGLPFLLRANEVAARSVLSPLQRAALRSTQDPPVGGPVNESTNPGVQPNDALFPFAASGIKVQAPGGVVYERAFRPSDATGSNVFLSAFRGVAASGGIKGIETPVFGECLLLPKGPPTPFGLGSADFNTIVTGRTPTDRPLYEFTNGASQNMNASELFPINPGPVFNELPVGGSQVAGPVIAGGDGRHRGSPGSVMQAYRHSHSREDGTRYGFNAELFDTLFDVNEQVRLLPGMVIEDVTNGTFYSVGDIGRWKDYTDGVNPSTNVTLGLEQPGSVTATLRSSSNGSLVGASGAYNSGTLTVIALPADGDTVTIAGTIFTARNVPALPTEFARGGSAATSAANLTVVINTELANTVFAFNVPATGVIALLQPRIGNIDPAVTVSTAFPGSFNVVTPTLLGGSNPEVFYDLSSYTNPRADVISPGSTNGFGDRVDDGRVRRPLAGHHIRITPNVEFVPVLGPRGVDGGLLPPRDLAGNIILGADAIFYSLGATQYDFSIPGDLGRFIYVCGTDDYVNTGWWVITDVIADYPINNGINTTPRTVAVVRKWKRGSEIFEGDTTTFKGALPLRDRAPVLRMTADYRFNDSPAQPSLFGPTFSDLVFEVTDSTNTPLISVTVTAATLAGNGVNDCVTLADFCNLDPDLNGANATLSGAVPANWIVWTAVSNTLYSRGASVEVTYDLSLLDETQLSEVLGPNAHMRCQFQSNTTSGPFLGGPFVADHSQTESDATIGFYSFVGHNSQLDRASGDRNNAALMAIPTAIDPNAAGVRYEAYSAARGLRWVFSAPLTEEQVGSYMHLTRPDFYRFGVQLASQDDVGDGGIAPDTTAWTSGKPRTGDTIFRRTDIFKVQRCPNTGDIILGGECEAYFPEIIRVQEGQTDQGKGRPLKYSSLSVDGLWPDTITGRLATSTGTNVDPIHYALQPVARYKKVAVSPRYGRSSSLIAHSGDNPSGQGPDGLSVAVAGRDHDPSNAGVADYRESMAHYLGQMWVLMNRQQMQRTRIGVNRLLPDWYADQHAIIFGDQAELFNANNPQPFSSAQNALAASTYTWSPAGEFWTLIVPKALRDSQQFDASVPHPTLSIDLTETFAQAMAPGSGENSPYPGKAPKGVRLMHINVNFGVWGDPQNANDKRGLPGFRRGLVENEVLSANYVAFNLVVQLPGSQARQITASNHPLGGGTAGLPFGDRAPFASYNHPDNSDLNTYPGGTVVVPLYVNREGGDMMPNVMERWVDSGPLSAYDSDEGLGSDPDPDWISGDYEHGFGVAGDSTTNQDELYGDSSLIGNAFNPILWGGIDTALPGEGGPFNNPNAARVLASPFPRSSRVSGGVRSAFTSGLVPDGNVFKKIDPHSLSSAAMTGIVVTHTGVFPSAQRASAGSFSAAGAGPDSEAMKICSHAVTLSLTPVGDDFETPKDGGGARIAVSAGVTPASGSEQLAVYGRTLQTNPYQHTPGARPFKVGNWLDAILAKYGVNAESGSMLPSGARVYLEVTAGPGAIGRPSNAAGISPQDTSSTGTWVGPVECVFEVETADGTAYTTNVNTLGEDGN